MGTSHQNSGVRAGSLIQIVTSPSSRIPCAQQRQTVGSVFARAWLTVYSCCMYQHVFYWFAGKRLAQTGEEGYDCGDRGWLSKEEIKDVSDWLWDKRADDCILLHQFGSMATQTFIRTEELLNLRRRNTWQKHHGCQSQAITTPSLGPSSSWRFSARARTRRTRPAASCLGRCVTGSWITCALGSGQQQS